MKILIVDDETAIREKITRFCQLDGFDVLAAENGLSAKRILEEEIVDAVVTDLSMPGLNGLELLEWIQEEGPALPVIMMSGYGTINDAVKAMKLGARDYLVKPFDPDELTLRLKRIVENRYLKEQLELGRRENLNFQGWVGESAATLAIKRFVEKIAPTPSTVLITGESGTGKEVIARTIHRLSPRAENPFVAINIGGMNDNLLESELFGYEKGAFTGASARKIGLFELASSGTLFLDEIGDMPIHLQVKLLRVLQERKIQRLGGTQSIPINVRVLTATNKNLEAQIENGLFREDLFYRLNVLTIDIPPLRDRKEDIPPLVGYFIQKFKPTSVKAVHGIQPDAIKALQNYGFPGNVRELENIIERAMILTQSDMISVKDLGIMTDTPKASAKRGTLDEIQKQVIIETLRRWEGNRTRAANELGINRRTLLNKIKEYGLTDL